MARWPRADSYYQRNSWAGKLQVNGTLVMDSPYNNALAHMLNLICFFAGSREQTSARIEFLEAELYRCRPIQSPDTAFLHAETESGIDLFFSRRTAPKAL